MEVKPVQPLNGQGISRTLLDAAPDSTAIEDTHGIIQFVNSQTEKLFGYKKDELPGKAVEILIPFSLHNILKRMNRKNTAALVNYMNMHVFKILLTF